jgi:hypothetical protein
MRRHRYGRSSTIRLWLRISEVAELTTDKLRMGLSRYRSKCAAVITSPSMNAPTQENSRTSLKNNLTCSPQTELSAR